MEQPPMSEPLPLPISAFIICLNEGDYIENCLLSLKDCAEIVVVDSGSTDTTLAIVERFIALGWPIRVFYQPWLGYAAQKQFALDKCTGDWCLNVDADERLDAVLAAALPDLTAADASVVGWRIGRRSWLPGYGVVPPYVHERKVLRLIRRGHGAFDLTQQVHEGIVATGKVADCRRGTIVNYRPLMIDAQLMKENKYSSIKADQKLAEGKTSNAWRLFFAPLLYFIKIYLFNRAFLCGRAGFVHAMTGYTYSFLTEAKLIQRQAMAKQPPHDDMDGESF
jgi:glycosyltransferase involved in cell wall biosynthesis